MKPRGMDSCAFDSVSVGPSLTASTPDAERNIHHFLIRLRLEHRQFPGKSDTLGLGFRRL
jgi:hypothetical protein